ncbi:MAG: ribonuclease Y [Chloroflexi bacterium]|nr:ribonuclease Y [Chloroflexota bacterium]
MSGGIALVIVGVVLTIVGVGLVTWSYVFSRRLGQHAQDEAQRITLEAEKREKELLLEAKDEALKTRQALEVEYRDRRRELSEMERRLQRKEEGVDRRSEQLDRRERTTQQREQQLENDHAEVEELKRRQFEELQRIGGMSTEVAQDVLLKRVEDEMRDLVSRRVREIEGEAKEEGERRARSIIASAIQRYAADQVAETAVTVVSIPSEDMKARIIGREGRNIRAFENATGVDLIIDETPDAVTLSSFDPVRREVARLALTRLIQDGRIHPANIEQVVERARREIDAVMRDEGEKAALAAHVNGLHPDLIRTLGRLHFRYSYGQNVLKHSVEVAHVAAMMAAEIGADVNVCRRGGLLHDIGKAIDHEVEGPHAEIGAELCRRLNASPKVVHCIATHHTPEAMETVEAIIVQAADSASGARPGARGDVATSYVKRLEALEQIATSFDGVERAYAIQAGREVRIIVNPDHIDDLGAARLMREIVKRIENELEYPGQIKVMVVRELRVVDYARR